MNEREREEEEKKIDAGKMNQRKKTKLTFFFLKFFMPQFSHVCSTS
jgi:hypothetical protein